MASQAPDNPSPSEWKVLRIVAERGECATRDVLREAADQHGWSDSTVKTLLRRLVEKGHLAARKVGNTFVYRPTGSVRRSLRDAADTLLQSAKSGTVGSLLAYMVKRSDLSREELDELRDLLEAERRHQGEDQS